MYLTVPSAGASARPSPAASTSGATMLPLGTGMFGVVFGGAEEEDDDVVVVAPSFSARPPTPFALVSPPPTVPLEQPAAVAKTAARAAARGIVPTPTREVSERETIEF